MAYTDASALKLYLGISTTDDDTLLGALIARAQAIIDAHTGRTFEAATDTTRYFGADAVCGRTLYLDKDLCAITTITNGDSVAVTSGDYITQPRNDKPWFSLVLKSDSDVAWNTSDGEIAIAGKWAYMATADAAIQHITIRLASWLYRQKDNHADMDRAAVVGDMTILPARLPKDIEDALLPYRRIVP